MLVVKNWSRFAGAGLVGLALVSSGLVQAADPAPASGSVATEPAAAGNLYDKKQYTEAVDKAVAWLKENQAADGSFSKASPAITAIVVTSLLKNGRPVNDPMIEKAMKYLEGFVQPTGGIHAPKARIVNYETAIITVCFGEANKDGKYKDLLANADKFLKGAQIDEADGKEKSAVEYGGAGYAPGQGRPDLSNTHYLVEALAATGNAADSEAMQKALVFVSRCQNLESEHNTTPFAAKINDGGFYYTPAGGGEGGKAPEGGLESYGSMTYAGLKSMIYAGVNKDDKRVKAALAWIAKNYDLKNNPGKGPSGLYYYYQLFGKSLSAAGVDQLTDASGKVHNWRQDLLTELAGKQLPNGSWTNTSDRFMEGDPALTTGFALLALSGIR